MEAIYILRHGHAQDPIQGQVKEDFNRRLTEEGKTKTKKVSLFFNKLKEDLDLVLSSPYLRAKETAEIFVNNLDPKPELKIVDFLSSGASSKDIAKGLLPYSSNKKLLLVGHAPDLEIFLGKLIAAESIKLKKAALAKVILNNSIDLAGELEWLVTPSIVKKFKLKEKEKISRH